MVVQPNSTIILYSGMPIDPAHNDSLYFDSIGAQTGFFQSNYILRTFSPNSYQRVNSGEFEAKCLADEIYNANYMAFQNTNFGSKWFYAFVDNVEYVNNGNTLVSYHIDVLQTYLFDAILEECYVEREHTVTDNLYENIVPEPAIVPTGDYQFEGYEALDPGTADGKSAYEPDIVVMYVDVDGVTVDGGKFNNTYSGAIVKSFAGTSAGVVSVNALISHYIQKPEAIINIYMCPHYISRGTDEGRLLTPANFWEPGDVHILPTQINAQFYRSIAGYAPKNKKLFTYPYTYLHMDDGGNDARVIRFEFFENENSFDFWIFGSNFSPIQLSISPKNYKGVSLTTGCQIERLTLSEYPLCSWNYDTYKAWEAQNGVPLLINTFSSALGSVASGDIGGLISTAGNVASSIYSASIASDTIRGTVSNGNALYSNNMLKFHYARAYLPKQYLKLVDDFFDMFGYAVKTVKVPNRNARPHWTYTKTNGCKVKGSCPSTAINEIEKIYDSGITWWVNAGEVGNYSLDNRPA